MVRYMVRSARAAARTGNAARNEETPSGGDVASPPFAPPLPPRPDAICDALKRLPQWAVWEARPASDASAGCPWRPLPVDPEACAVAGRPPAGGGAPFAVVAEALAAGGFAGVGLLLREEDPFAVVTVEDAVTPDGAALTPEAARVVERLGSYTELSADGRGVQVFVRAVLPPGGRRREGLEMADAARFVPVTGRVWPGAAAEVAVRQREVEALHAESFPNAPPPPRQGSAAAGPPPQRDDDLLAVAFGGANGSRIRALFRGEPEALAAAGGGDRGAADLALCSLLGFYAGDDPARLDRLYRRSALFRPRWDVPVYSDGRTYGQAVVAKALNGCLLFHAYPRAAAPAAPAGTAAPPPAARPSVPFTVARAGDSDPIRAAEVQGRAQGMALRDRVLTAGEAAAVLKVSARLLRKTVKPWRRFGSTPAGDRWLLSDLMG